MSNKYEMEGVVHAQKLVRYLMSFEDLMPKKKKKKKSKYSLSMCEKDWRYLKSLEHFIHQNIDKRKHQVTNEKRPHVDERSHVGEYTPYKHKHQNLWLKFRIDVNEFQLALDFLNQYTRETIILQ